jgi:hypothetical protein
MAGGDLSTVGGGYINAAGGDTATVGGGTSNTAGDTSVVGGGEGNTASNGWATVAGGYYNHSVFYGTVGGGGNNNASGMLATVAGGNNNTASGYEATVPGGEGNVASGGFSFAAGFYAHATNDGAFVWTDSSVSSTVYSSRDNQFTARCAGGVRFFSNGGATVGVQVAPGGNSWSALSDRSVKENFKPVDVRAVLEKVAAMPVTEWNLKSQDTGIRHIGPMAQDFKEAFTVGEDDRHISTSDADGVQLAAIQGLYQVVQDREKEMTELRKQNAALAEGLRDLKAQVQEIAGKSRATSGSQARSANDDQPGGL